MSTRQPLRLTDRGHAVVEGLKVVCILVTLACTWAILTMIGY
jgi:hypothetical protein